jgi:hypothetical protein
MVKHVFFPPMLLIQSQAFDQPSIRSLNTSS